LQVITCKDAGRYLCMHGGIAPSIRNLHDISHKIDRFIEPGQDGPYWYSRQGSVCCADGGNSDLLWSDPFDEENCKGWPDSRVFNVEWKYAPLLPRVLIALPLTCPSRENESRGCGTMYGYVAVARFLRENDLKGIVRAHEVKKFGFEEHKYRTPDPMVRSLLNSGDACLPSARSSPSSARLTTARLTRISLHS
jgi:diadenosine tetraphosphatase ApaH/serine/threonine PP2A family protein phosphatase